MKKLIFFTLIFCFLFSAVNLALAQEKEADVVFFYSSTCPHCAAEEKFLDELKGKYPQLEIKSYEVIYSAENQKILEEYFQKYNVPDKEKGYVPVTFTQNKYFIGFSEQIGKDISAVLEDKISQSVPAKDQTPQVVASSSVQEKKVEINFFYSSTCPHCAKEEKFLETLKQKYPELEIKYYEVVNSSQALDNIKVLEEFFRRYNVPDTDKGGVPITFTPTKYFVGFGNEIAKDMENCLKE